MSWNAPKTWLGEKITATKLNREIRDNFEALKNPPHAEYAPAYAASTLISTSSTSFVDMTGFLLSIDTTGGAVLVTLNVAGPVSAYFDIKVNGSRVGGVDGLMYKGQNASGLLLWLITDLEPQTLSIQAMWKTNGATFNLRNEYMPYFSAREVS